MVGIGTVLLLLACGTRWRGCGGVTCPGRRWFYRCAAVAGVASVVAVESGWITAEVGRQPWIVFEQMKVAEAVTNISAGPIWVSFAILVVVYALIAWAFVGLLLRMRIRWRREDAELGHRRRRGEPRSRREQRLRRDQRGRRRLGAGPARWRPTPAAGGADYGAGFWDLTAGGDDRGARPRALVDHAMAPVWEANNVWLVFVLIITWTGFPTAFESVLSTAWIAITLAALGLVLRGSGFALRKPTRQLTRRRRYAAVFGISSILTPFFFAATLGGVASGRIPVGNRAGDLVTSWLNPTSVLFGVLAVAVSAFTAAVFLVSDAHRFGAPDLESYFRRRSGLAGCAVVGGGADRTGRPAVRRPVRVRRAAPRLGTGVRCSRTRRHARDRLAGAARHPSGDPVRGHGRGGLAGAGVRHGPAAVRCCPPR